MTLKDVKDGCRGVDYGWRKERQVVEGCKEDERDKRR